VRKAIQQRYEGIDFPTGKYLKALLLRKSIEIDETVIGFICQSAFTNLVSSFPDFKDCGVELIPSSVFLLLVNGAESCVNDYTLEGKIAKNVNNLTELYTEDFQTKRTVRFGD
jgi:hypothetical protein